MEIPHSQKQIIAIQYLLHENWIQCNAVGDFSSAANIFSDRRHDVTLKWENILEISQSAQLACENHLIYLSDYFIKKVFFL